MSLGRANWAELDCNNGVLCRFYHGYGKMRVEIIVSELIPVRYFFHCGNSSSAAFQGASKHGYATGSRDSRIAKQHSIAETFDIDFDTMLHLRYPTPLDQEGFGRISLMPPVLLFEWTRLATLLATQSRCKE
jgi:hypothetical protein